MFWSMREFLENSCVLLGSKLFCSKFDQKSTPPLIDFFLVLCLFAEGHIFRALFAHGKNILPYLIMCFLHICWHLFVAYLCSILIGQNLTALLMGSHRGHWRQNSNSQRWLQALPSFLALLQECPRRACLQASWNGKEHMYAL